MRILSALLLLAISCFAAAGDYALPTGEQAFLGEIHSISKSVVLERLGDPGNIMDIRDRDSGEVVGTAWQYHYLNTTEDGDYYKTTELDFVGDRVVTVVFSNTDYEEDNTPDASSEAEHTETF
jgi:hypothetical protein